jgi:hypothetical protein
LAFLKLVPTDCEDNFGFLSETESLSDCRTSCFVANPEPMRISPSPDHRHIGRIDAEMCHR